MTKDSGTVPRRRRPSSKRRQALEPNGAPPVSKAVARALDVLEAFPNEFTRLGLTEIAARVELPAASLFRILQTLGVRGYLEQAADGTYRLAPKLLHGKIREQADKLRQTARPHLQALAMRFNETASLAYLFEDRIQVVDTIETLHAMRLTNRPGRVLPPHCSSMGKSITACQKPEKIDRILEVYGLVRRTAHTITDRATLFAEYDRIRDQGYAFDREEATEGGFCVGAPIRNDSGPVVAAISLSIPLIRFNAEQESATVSAVLETARAIARALETAE